MEGKGRRSSAVMARARVPAAVFGGALLAAAGDGEEAEGALARMKRQRNQ